jgi:hypothetical protein
MGNEDPRPDPIDPAEISRVDRRFSLGIPCSEARVLGKLLRLSASCH